MRLRILFTVLGIAALAASGLSAAAPGTASAPVTVDAVDYAYAMPTTVKGGVVAMRFRNKGRELHEFAFGRIDPGHTLAEARRSFETGKDTPWLHDLGGPGLLTRGSEIEITRVLRPGTYFFLCGIPDHKGVSHLERGMLRSFTVVGDSGRKLPAANAVITAGKRRFFVPQLSAGSQTIELRNRAGAGRGFQLTSINPGKTEADVNRWAKAIETTGKQPRGPMPFTILGAMQTIPSGTSVYLKLDLEAGRSYHLSDDESGIEADFTPR
ncbi:hypothetical protein [Gaiella sp.]|uniref:hypothetical protein n=1 Tax=Gaiella sp. TaxID=2663207 RepID=UPI0032634BC7